MNRIRIMIAVVLAALVVPVLLVQFASGQREAIAAQMAAGAPQRNIGVVMDTTATMGPELITFSNAWQNAAHLQGAGVDGPTAVTCHEPPFCGPLTATLRLVEFKDAAQLRGTTTDYDTFVQGLAGLEASGGGTCPDNALVGLLTMAKNLPESRLLPSDVLLVTDATPYGNRANYAYVINRMLQRGINVHALISGWCAGAPVPEAVMDYLTLATGGKNYRVASPSEYYTLTLIAQNRLFATDMLLAETGSVSPGTPDMIPLRVDTTMSALSAEGSLSYTGCLTCQRTVAGTLPLMEITAVSGMQFELIDPDSNVIDTSTAGYETLSMDSRELLRFYTPLTATLKTGTWHLRVSGSGDYAVSVMAQSDLHLAYLGPSSIPASQPSLLRAALGVPHNNVIHPPLTATFKLVPVDGVGAAQPVLLFDDGQHNDGAAGDGIFGGMVQPNGTGWWRLAAEGEWTAGNKFQRLADVPLRVQSYRLPTPDAAVVKPSESRPVSFTLVNEDTSSMTFELGLFSEQGWTVTNTVPAEVILAPGETYTLTTTVEVPPDAAAGVLEETMFVAVAANDVGLGISAVAETRVIEYRVYLPAIVRD